jgi:hypothetical protein
LHWSTDDAAILISSLISFFSLYFMGKVRKDITYGAMQLILMPLSPTLYARLWATR